MIRSSSESGFGRPQIVVPESDSQFVKPGEVEWNLLRSGDPVRVIMSKSNISGHVVEVKQEAQRTVSGGWMPGADIELESGEVVFVPYTNIDVFN